MAKPPIIASPGPVTAECAAGQQVRDDLVRGDAAAIEDFVRTHQQLVARLARRLLAWEHDVEDVVQEVFVSALQHLPRFRGESRVSTWLYGITVNECHRHQRRRGLRLWPLGRPAPGPATTHRDSTARDPATSAVREAVANLPVRDREVIVLRSLMELPIPEIASILEVRANSVEVRLTRARARLGRALQHVEAD
jgi:RNA polymerase sigma-70 factor (ECF subfamily)